MNQLFENKTLANIEPKKLGLIERRLRMSSNLTIEQTAKCLNISRGNLCEIENGKRGLKDEVFLKFIDLFWLCCTLGGFLSRKKGDVIFFD